MDKRKFTVISASRHLIFEKIIYISCTCRHILFSITFFAIRLRLPSTQYILLLLSALLMNVKARCCCRHGSHVLRESFFYLRCSPASTSDGYINLIAYFSLPIFCFCLILIFIIHLLRLRCMKLNYLNWLLKVLTFSISWMKFYH